MKSTLLLAVLFVIANSYGPRAQDSVSVYNKVYNFPDKLFGHINNKATWLQEKFVRQSEKYLHKLAKQEKKLPKQLYKKDSAAANRLFGNPAVTCQQLADKLKNKTGKVNKFRNVYSGHLGSMTTALGFLKENKLLRETPEVFFIQATGTGNTTAGV